MATATHTTLASEIDRAAVMRDAWTEVKSWYQHRNRRFVFVRADFRDALRRAWHSARMDMLTGTERRIAALREEIEFLNYKSLAINIEPRRRALEAELRSLGA